MIGANAGYDTAWSELVTTALLGTGRRPVPNAMPAAWAPPEDGHTDPAVRVLDLAARHRALARSAAPMATVDFPADADRPVPADDRPPPPPEASVVLSQLLVQPSPGLINFWLACAADQGCGVPARHWTRLARLAAHSTAYDRTRLGRVLGGRGRWFLEQNPDWRRLAADCVAGSERVGDPPALRPAQGASLEAVRARPAAIFDEPDPWPAELVAVAYAVIGSGASGRKARDFAARVGARLPIELYTTLGPAAEYYLQAPEATPARRRQIREAFVIMEWTAARRVEVARAFSVSSAALVALRRLEIPGV